MLNASQFILLFDYQSRLLKAIKISFAKDIYNRSSSRLKDRNLENCFNNFSVLDDFGLIKRSFWTCFGTFHKMPRRAPRYNPTALRIWRMLKRMGITSPRGIFLSLLFWCLFICFTYFSYTELSKLLAKIEARKFDISKLDPRLIIDNDTLLASKVRQWDALGLFKTY